MTIPAKYADRVWLTPQEVAAMTPFAPRSIVTFCERGEIHGKQVAGRWMLDAASVWKWLGCETSGRACPPPIAEEIAKRLGW